MRQARPVCYPLLLMQAPKEIWFPAKKYGYGWGFPVRWQGWVVIALYGAAVAAGVKWFTSSKTPLYFTAYMIGISAALLVVCAWKGESPRWRWGKD